MNREVNSFTSRRRSPIILSIVAIVAISGLCLSVYLRLYTSLPTLEAFAAYLPPGSRYDPVSLDAISEEMRLVTIAVDQPDFYTRTSDLRFAPWLRAVVYSWQCSRAGACSRDGGTISQKVVSQWRFVMGGPPLNTFQGEMHALLLNDRLARRCTQDEILTFYLNQTFYGDGVYGIEAAAQYYFGKSAADLTLGEAAVLQWFAIFPAMRDVTQIEEGIAVLLQRMVDLGYITEDRAQHAQETTPLPDIINR